MQTVNRVNEWDGGGLPTPVNGNGGMIEVASTRAAQEVQAAMVMAKKFPRNEMDSYARIMKSCKRKTLAEQALYAYPKGGQTVTGPSIRLAEAMAQAWGNVDFGIVELEQKKGESAVMAYAWDLETNTRQTKIFTVKHERHTKTKTYDLTDPRDIYELTANQGARRLRACILGVIPGDVVDAAVVECEKTMAGGSGEPLADRIRAMVVAFGEMSVTPDLIEKRLGHKVEVTTEAEVVGLKKIYRALRDNMASIGDFFDVGTASDRPASKLADKLKDEPDVAKPSDFDRPPLKPSAAAEKSEQPAPAGSVSRGVQEDEPASAASGGDGGGDQGAAPAKLTYEEIVAVAQAKKPASVEEGAATFRLGQVIRKAAGKVPPGMAVKQVWNALGVEQQYGVKDAIESDEFAWVEAAKK